MNILIIGSGGREHAIGLKLKKDDPELTLFFAPGNAGTAELGRNLPIADTDIEALLRAADQHAIQLTIVGPEQPLVDGIVDRFNVENKPIIGPCKRGAQLEGSKDWAKAFMTKYGIPTAAYATFTDLNSALSYLDQRDTYPIVIKADGLAAGKGVTIAHSVDEAKAALDACFITQKFGHSGHKVVIEDFLQGEEASIFAFTDGHVILPMTPAQDHKAVFDGDTGPNTGGMGAYSPAPLVTPAIQQRVMDEVFTPLLKGFQREGILYKGIVYAGLMIDSAGNPSIVEFNARFGDPETQVVLPRLKTPLLTVLNAVYHETLSSIQLEWSDTFAVGVVCASQGYPGAYQKNVPIQLPENPEGLIIHAGTTRNGTQLVTNGGRVLCAVGQAADLQTAIDRAYALVDAIHYDTKMYRRDIGQKAFRHL